MSSRLSPERFWRPVHQDVIAWLNQLAYDIMTYLQAEHAPLIQPNYLRQWPALRDDLVCTEWYAQAWRTFPIHAADVLAINTLVEDLAAVWEKRDPARAITVDRIEEINHAINAINQCRADPKRY